MQLCWKISKMYIKEGETELCQSSTRGHRWCCFRTSTCPLTIRPFISSLIRLWLLALSCKKTTANMLFNKNLMSLSTSTGIYTMASGWCSVENISKSLFISRGVDLNSSDTLVLIMVGNKWAALSSAVSLFARQKSEIVFKVSPAFRGACQMLTQKEQAGFDLQEHVVGAAVGVALQSLWLRGWPHMVQETSEVEVLSKVCLNWKEERGLCLLNLNVVWKYQWKISIDRLVFFVLLTCGILDFIC